jgi:hypothetical protein
LLVKLTTAQRESKHAQADLEAQLDKREKKLADYHKKVSTPHAFTNEFPH